MNVQDMQEQLATIGNGAHALASQILGNPHDAEDAVHDAIAKVLGRPQAYDASKGPLRPWFLRLLRNHCIDLVRRRRSGTDDVDALREPGPGPEQTIARVQRDQALHKALASLAPNQRQIVVLRDYMDLSYAEIAGVLEIAPGTVMSRLHRARMNLKEALSRHD